MSWKGVELLQSLMRRQGWTYDITDVEGLGGVAVVAIEVYGDVYVDDVAIHERMAEIDM